MEQETKIAKHAVRIVQIIKENLEQSAQQVIHKILDEIPELTTDELIHYLHSMYSQLKTDAVLTINEIIEAIQQEARESISDIHWNSLWQDIAQGIVYVATVLKGLLPPKWAAVITLVLNAYMALKGGA